jgi:DNA helicase-2/ATP-dependent DNA helicase PcrA
MIHKNGPISIATDDLASRDWPFYVEPILDCSRAYASDGQTVAEYLAWLATYDIQDEIKDEEAPAISLMTIHAAKGLEWPVVIVSGCNEGILPSKQALGNGDLEAERRLAYVAWTRAKDQLVLTVRPEIDDQGRENPVSRFIGESGL